MEDQAWQEFVDSIPDIDNAVEEWKDKTLERMEKSLNNKSLLKAALKRARLESSILMHKAKQEEDYDLVREIKKHLKSLKDLEFGLKGGQGY